jgi:hypothetical protein
MIAAAAPTKLLKFFLVFIPVFIQADISMFTPPKAWSLVDDSLLAPHVKVGFFTKSKQEFCPSINLSEEKITITFKQYLKAVQKIHESDPKNRWRSLGEIPTKEGNAALSSIDTETSLGKIRLLQMIFCKGETAYILTGASLLEDFSKYQKEFLNAFKSFRLMPDSILEEKAESIASTLNKDSTKEIQKALKKETEEGGYFQLLLLKKLSPSN